MASILNATTSSGLVTSADNSGSLQLATNNGTTAVTIDTSQNVGIGSTSPVSLLEVKDASPVLTINQTDTSTTCRLAFYGYNRNYETTAINTTEGGTAGAGNLVFWTNPGGSGNSTERMRISSAGTLFIGGTTSPSGTQRLVLTANGSAGIEPMLFNELRSTSATENYVQFYRNGSQVGSISNTLSATAYNTSSDYRLKENIAPMTGALAKVSQLKPCTYTWKATGETSQGFIAHELQEIVPDCVSGAKDAVETYTDEDGNEQTRIKPQGVDTSFLVATLTAAIQELKAELDATKAEVQALKGTL